MLLWIALKDSVQENGQGAFWLCPPLLLHSLACTSNQCLPFLLEPCWYFSLSKHPLLRVSFSPFPFGLALSLRLVGADSARVRSGQRIFRRPWLPCRIEITASDRGR